MKELKKSTILLVILIIGFLVILYSFLEFDSERNNKSLRPKFNSFQLLFLSIVYSLSSVPFIFCFFKNRKHKDSDLYQ